MDVRKAYDDHRAISIASGLKCEDKSLTLQSQAQDADINVIMKRFGVTGVLPQVALPPSYGDFDSVSDYSDAVALIREANASFNALSASVRARFDNDPALFVNFCCDPSNIDAMREMGLAVPKPIPAANASKEVRQEKA